MSSYDELEKEFKQKVEELQERCKHEKTYWAEQWWAIGHSTGFAVKVCKVCSKQVDKISLGEAYEKGYLKDMHTRIEEWKMKRRGVNK